MSEFKLPAFATLVTALLCTGPAHAGSQQYKLKKFVFPVDQQNYPEVDALNALNQAVGTLANPVHGAGYLSTPSAPTELQGVGHGTIEARAINIDGVVCGSAWTQPDNGASKAAVWNNGQIRLLAPLYGQNTFPNANAHCFGVNDNGVLVGESDVRGTASHAVEWNGSNTHDLVGLGGDANNSVALAINNSGMVVGTSVLSGSEYHATAWINEVVRLKATPLPH